MKLFEVVWLLDFLLVSLVAVQMKENEENSFPTRSKRVIGGKPADMGSWPWLASLHASIPNSYFWGVIMGYKNYYCGASLVHKQWVLTAAHCVIFKELEWKPMAEYITIKVGEIKREASFTDKLKGTFSGIFGRPEWSLQIINIVNIHVHPQYEPEVGYHYDLALLKLETPAILDVPVNRDEYSFFGAITSIMESKKGINIKKSRVGVVKLSRVNQTGLKDNVTCTLKGWGCTSIGKPASPVALEVKLRKLNDYFCEQIWRLEMVTRLCAGSLGESIHGMCHGDSGSPLLCPIGKEMIQVGIASFVNLLKPGEYPGGFTRISTFRKWIDKIIATYTK